MPYRSVKQGRKMPHKGFQRKALIQKRIFAVNRSESTAFAGFRQGMGLMHDPFQMVAGDMGIDFGGGDVGMAQERLDAAQVRAAFHQMGGEGMAQHMGRNLG